ncbi:hypothetical protein DASC09_047980 [Saccharomycopsis crataegensis]|uniref:Uncharacterized protein n=1 Tax=Saccharomycopsis crataegensis TaxID=43959 RepID=A0AAV5QRC8_9ASCO|nr:hypothetical protein DASC09_047980 [Saccharomycopsis crataegensis]
MVKKVVYPTRRSNSTNPYDYSTNRVKQEAGNPGHENNCKSQSLFSRIKGFFGSWNPAVNNNENENGAMEDSTTTSTNSSAITTIQPFKYPAPDADFISNISSRKLVSTPTTSAFGTPNNSLIHQPNNGTTPKDKLIKYLHEKGISELEAEGILSIAKQIDSDNTDPNISKSIDYLVHNNEYQPYLKKPSDEPNDIEEEKEKQEDDKKQLDLQTPKPKRKVETSMFANNTTSFMDSSIYMTANKTLKRNTSHSEASSPFKMNITKRPKTVHGKDFLKAAKVNNSTILANNTTFNDKTFVTAREYSDDDSTMTTAKNDGPITQLSSTATALLGILDADKPKDSEKPAVKESKKKYEIYINPYVNSSLSRSSRKPKSRNSSELQTPDDSTMKDTTANTSNNKLLTIVENTIAFDKSASFDSAPSSTPFTKPPPEKKPESTTPIELDIESENATLKMAEPSIFNTGENGAKTSTAMTAMNKYKPSKSSSLRSEVFKKSPEGKTKTSGFSFGSASFGPQSTNVNTPLKANGETKKNNNALAFSTPQANGQQKLNGGFNKPLFGNSITGFSSGTINKEETSIIQTPTAKIVKPITPITRDLKPSNVEVIDVSDDDEMGIPESTAVVKKDTSSISPVMPGPFDRLFFFPAAIKQQYLLTDVDEAQVQMYKGIFSFET